jgi:ATP-dependent helicase STH1/SNF2
MRQEGVREDDPEFLRLKNLINAVQQQNNLRRNQKAHQEQLARQRQQQQAQQQGVQGQAVAQAPNGINGVCRNVPLVAITNDDTGQAPSINRSDGAPATPTEALISSSLGGAGASGVAKMANFTPSQVSTLRAQIMAFKVLSKNLPIPANLQGQLFASQQAKTAAIGTSTATATPAAATAPEPRHWYDSYEDPYAGLRRAWDMLRYPNDPNRVKTIIKKRDRISYSEHAIRSRRPLVGSLIPAGVDVERVRHERERIIYNRINARRDELEATPMNMAQWDTSKSDTPVADDSIRMKALIELKMLRLLGKQREMRQRVSREILHHDNLAQTANRTNYRRQKKTTLREARVTENLEKRQRDARETNEKKKQFEQIQAILQHGREIRENAQLQRARAARLGKLMIQHHGQIEKEEQKRIERTAKQRLQALKNDDEATYLKLLGQAKDTRITHLLSQTDGFLKQLAASVKEQQKSAMDNYRGEDGELPEDDVSDSDDEEGAAKVDYYQVAHRIKEEVTAQASILVGGTLKEYQIKGLQWMLSLYNNNLNGILADEMGLGKTIQTISLITYLIEKKKQNGPYLVIVPLSTLTNWNMEFDKWAPSLQKIVYKGPPNVRKTQQNQIRYGNFQVLLTTYEYIIKDRPVLSKIKWLHMIIDEGHRMKNAQSKLSSILTQYYHTRYRLILTGTPLQNNLPELWALLNFVLPTIFKSVKSFDEWFNTPFANTGGQDRIELTEEEQLLVIRRLHKVLRPFLLRRLKKDVEKDLPDKTERVVKCRFSALQVKLYKQLTTYSQISVSDGKGGKQGMRGLTNMLMQLRKLCNHPFVFEQVEEQMNPEKVTNDLIWRTAGKFELLDRVLPKFKATGHRVLMFFQMTQIMNIMEDFLRYRGLQYLRLDGSTKSDDRSELLKLFNAPDSPYFCFLLSTRAGGLGLNLQTADTVIIYDSDWNPHQDLQAQDRAHRIGQKNEVRILRLISSNSVEEKILERARYKLDMDDKVIQAGKFDNKSTNEERENLLRTLLDAAESTEAFTQEEMDDDDLNIQMARSDQELITFGEMDKERALNSTFGPEKQFPRLLGESELPEIYMSEDNPVPEVVEEYAGRGARERTRVKYDDGLTEEQWLNAVDDDEDTIEDAIARHNARVDKRQTNKERRARSGPDNSPEAEHHSSEEPEPEPESRPKKRSRKSNPPKRKAEEEVEETPPTKKKRGRATKPVETLSPADRKTIQDILNNVFQYLMEVQEPALDDAVDAKGRPLTRGLIDPFIKLVSRHIYPDYYTYIKEPMSMEMIEKKINRLEYQTLKEFFKDIQQICVNARTYNEDGSVLYNDANKVEVCVSHPSKTKLLGY